MKSRTHCSRGKLQRRVERYASTGPNCPNGHPWATNAKFNYRGYRFCNACMEAKAQVRKDDPSTYTGACPKGHEFTRENTVITNWNSKVCLTCQRANYNKISDPDLFENCCTASPPETIGSNQQERCRRALT